MIQAWLLRQVPLIVVSLAIIGAGLWVGNTLIERGRNEVRPLLDKALSERDNLLAQLENEKVERRRAEEAVDAYSKEVTSLRRRPRGKPVRVCFNETTPMPAPGTAASDPDGTAALAGGLSGTARGDLEALRELAYQCDVISAQLRALQKWASSVDQTAYPRNSN
jgi:hypothetical protein